MVRTKFLARTALGFALSLGVAGIGLTSTAALAKKEKKEEAPGPAKLIPSKGFAKIAAPYGPALEAAKTRADVVAAKQRADAALTAVRNARGAARKPADAELAAAVSALGATLTAEKTQLDAVFAVIVTPDDRYFSGQYAYQLGNMAHDNGIKRRGIAAMIESGKAMPKDVPNLQFVLASLAYDSGDYPAAASAFSVLANTTYPDEAFGELLADSYAKAGKPTEGLAALSTAIAARKAAGVAVPSSWTHRGFIVAYNAKMLPESADWARRLIEADPTPVNWVSAVQITRDLPGTGWQENLDLARLIFRNGAINIDKRVAEHEYVEYIQAADPRRLPGEVVKVAQAGVASGALRANDTFVIDAITQGKSRMVADKAAMVALERDARAANANAATVTAAGDTFLSYDQPAKAEEFYKLAVAKPGADAERVLTRLGIAQYDQGKWADAEATFAKISGSRKPIAQLWALLTRFKGAPAT